MYFAGHDVAAFLLHDPAPEHSGNERSDALAAAADSAETEKFMSYWGIDGTLQSPGGVLPRNIPPPRRQLYLLQRKSDKVGGGLGKTTGWIHRAILKVMCLDASDWLPSHSDAHYLPRTIRSRASAAAHTTEFVMREWKSRWAARSACLKSTLWSSAPVSARGCFPHDAHVAAVSRARCGVCVTLPFRTGAAA